MDTVPNTALSTAPPSSPEMFSDGQEFEDVQPEIEKILKSKALQQDSFENTSFPSILGSVKSYDQFEESIKPTRRNRPGRPKKKSWYTFI